MLSPQALERTTAAYRRGYREGYKAGTKAAVPESDGTFRGYDYTNGFTAGQNDRKWDDVRTGT